MRGCVTRLGVGRGRVKDGMGMGLWGGVVGDEVVLGDVAKGVCVVEACEKGGGVWGRGVKKDLFGGVNGGFWVGVFF